ncbi:hypothetical protein [Rahnella variigena]|jgi:hypothetical protein|uniref:hypothetical protein n=1 Tax=Rahnella variigena TaxID=574964 RepID=UPI00142E9E55|nr:MULTISPECIES: hypothetical protein [Rahnella]
MNPITTPEGIIRNPLYLEVSIKLITLTHSLRNGKDVPPQDAWATTRQISDALDISIYKARLILLDLVKLDLVLVSDRQLRNSLRWYPHASAHNLLHDFAVKASEYM